MPFIKGQPRPETAGRRKGSRNKRTREAEEFATRIIEDPKYQESLKFRLIKGTAPHMETLLFHYKFGKPVERKSVGFEDENGEPTTPSLTLILKHANRAAREADRGVRE